MKILLFGDAHFCERSSIVTKYGQQYSVRLENQLRTFNWIKDQMYANGCELIIGLGDFFDKCQLSDTEITAAKELPLSTLPAYLLVGNHESSYASLEFSSTKLLESSSCKAIYVPSVMRIGSTEVCLLPYVTESDRRALADYFPKADGVKNRIILSHNDISGISYGPVTSTEGFGIKEIEENCDLFINAHIHNGQQISSKIYNIGNITGQNFSEDASKYSHNIIILDTETLNLKFIENPHAFNFYKIQIDCESDILSLDKLKNNAVVSIKCIDKYAEAVRERISANSNIIDTRLILIKTFEESEEQTVNISDLAVDQCVKFAQCCREKLDNTPILEAELAEILK